MSVFLAEFLISSSWQRALEAESSDRLQWERQREHGVEPGHRYTGRGGRAVSPRCLQAHAEPKSGLAVG